MYCGFDFEWQRLVVLMWRLEVIVSFVRGSVFFVEGLSEDALYHFFSFLFRYIVLVHKVLWPFINIHCTFLIYCSCMFLFHLPFHVLFLFSLYTHASCCEIFKYTQVYEPYRSIVGQEWDRTHKDLNERRKIN